jgi:hypothetical protein
MGKIRSTLDIVMERTKGLSMTQEDKGRLKEKELSGHARAMAQRYLDGKMSIRELRSEIQASGGGKDALLRILREDLIGGMAPDLDNSRIIDALEDLWGFDRKRGVDTVRSREESLRSEMSSHMDRLMTGLADQGIRGSSVIPNVAVDPSWQAALLQAREALHKDVGSLL